MVGSTCGDGERPDADNRRTLGKPLRHAHSPPFRVAFLEPRLRDPHPVTSGPPETIHQVEEAANQLRSQWRCSMGGRKHNSHCNGCDRCKPRVVTAPCKYCGVYSERLVKRVCGECRWARRRKVTREVSAGSPESNRRRH
jgi:hypothetical protein